MQQLSFEFTRPANLCPTAFSDDRREQVGIGDDTLDCHPHLFKTHFSDDMSGLYRNDWKGNFDNMTLPARVCAETG